MREDSLNEKLVHRPTAAELVRDGVLQEDPTSIDELSKEEIKEE